MISRDIKNGIANAQQRLRAATKLATAANTRKRDLSRRRHLLEGLIGELEDAEAWIRRIIEMASRENAGVHHALVSQQKADGWPNRAPAPNETGPVLEWLAQRIVNGPQHQRLGICQRGRANDPTGMNTAATAALFYTEPVGFGSSRRRREFAIGGALGVRLLQEWPRKGDGSLTTLGPMRVAGLLEGKAGEATVRNLVEQMERAHALQAWRRYVIDEVVETVLDEEGRRRLPMGLTAAWWGSADEFRKALATIAECTGIADIATVDRRVSMVNQLLPDRVGLSEERRQAMQAAFRSSAALRNLLQRWAASPPDLLSTEEVSRALEELE